MLLLATLVVRATDDDGVGVEVFAERPGSELVSADAGAFGVDREPLSWRIVYRLEERTPSDTLDVGTDEIWVDRPFRSRFEVRGGPPPGGERFSVEIGAFARLETSGRDRQPLTVEVPPGVAPADVRVGDVLDDALARGVIELRERRRVAGRECVVIRSAGPLSATELRPASPAEHADSCVDAAGLVLEELFVVGGEPISRRVAVEVEVDPVLDADLFGTGEQRITINEGGGSVREVDPTTRRLGPFFELPGSPPGFRHIGRFEVVPPQAQNFQDPRRDKFIVTSVADVYQRGPDLVVVDQGATLRGGDPFPPAREATSTVEIPALGAAELIVSARGSEIRTRQGNGRFVRVYGTVPMSSLEALARQLVATEGDGLRYLDEA